MGLYLRGQWVDVESIADFDAFWWEAPRRAKGRASEGRPPRAIFLELAFFAPAPREMS